MAGLRDFFVVVANKAAYDAAVIAGKTSPSVMYLVLAERQIYFNSELWTPVDTVDTSKLATKAELEEAEEVTAAALADLDARVVWLSENVSGQAVSKEEFSAAFANLMQIITENEEVNAAAWNDLDTRLKSMGG